LDALDDGAVHEDIAKPDDIVGCAANVAELADFARALPDLRVTVEHAWSADRFRVVEYVLSGTQVGPFRGIAATGKPMTIHAVDIDEIASGKLLRRTTATRSSGFVSSASDRSTSRGPTSRGRNSGRAHKRGGDRIRISVPGQRMWEYAQGHENEVLVAIDDKTDAMIRQLEQQGTFVATPPPIVHRLRPNEYPEIPTRFSRLLVRL
jgi:hypothetical protein